MDTYEYKTLTVLLEVEKPGLKPLSKLNQQTKKGWEVDEKFFDDDDVPDNTRRLVFILKRKRQQ